MNNNELKHYGVLGMRWRHHKYQNPDGTLTKKGVKHQKKMSDYRDRLVDKTMQESENNYYLSKSNGYNQSTRSAFLKLSNAQKYGADILKRMDKKTLSEFTSKKELKKYKEQFEEKQFNSYLVAYHADGNVELINPYKN